MESDFDPFAVKHEPAGNPVADRNKAVDEMHARNLAERQRRRALEASDVVPVDTSPAGKRRVEERQGVADAMAVVATLERARRRESENEALAKAEGAEVPEDDASTSDVDDGKRFNDDGAADAE